jgi:hypothetical protein
MPTSYPELPKVKGNVLTYISLENAVHLLLSLTTECTARAVFGIMYAEARKVDNNFKSAGHYNYSGVQTDSGRWGFSDPIKARFEKKDVSGKLREFAAFKDDAGFFEFMINRIEKKGFNGCDPNQWTTTYIQSWWSPAKKNEYKQGSQKFKEKKDIYLSSMKRFDLFKKTFKGSTQKAGFKIGTWFIPLLAIAAIFIILDE